jgi:hypothetical protein
MADVGAIGRAAVAGFRDKEALVAADAAYGAKAEDTEEPIPEWALGVVEGFGVAGGTYLSVGKHGHLIGCDVTKFRFGVNYF